MLVPCAMLRAMQIGYAAPSEVNLTETVLSEDNKIEKQHTTRSLASELWPKLWCCATIHYR